ncbi:MAG: hypothetical protein ACREHG_09475, partial [Candidatus Saccharimonadales bacterium]
MRLIYSDKLKIAGIGLVPWTRLGPEQWLPSYAVASLYDWDVPQDQRPLTVHALIKGSDPSQLPPKLNTRSMLESKAFCNMLDQELPGYAFLTYRPVEIPDHLKSHKFLMTDTRFTKLFENKAACRGRFSRRITFPDHDVYKFSDLQADRPGYEKVRKGRQKVVIQDELLSGSKGTYVVSSYEDYLNALKSLRTPHDRSVIVSSFIDGARERSVQACVTKDGIVVGPLQRQIVSHRDLVDPSTPSDKFCG